MLAAAGEGRGSALPDTTAPKADDIVLAIENAIVTGELAPGALLRQERLAETFGVSRTPVREALRRLDAKGLVSLAANRGARVRSLSPADLREAFAVRAELEGRAAELAATKLTPEARDRIRAAEAQFASLTDELHLASSSQTSLQDVLTRWAKANDDFHDAVLEASGVTLLLELARTCRRVFFGQLVGSWNGETEDLLIKNVQQHRIVRELLETGSAPAARAAMHEHIVASGELMEQSLFGPLAQVAADTGTNDETQR